MMEASARLCTEKDIFWQHDYFLKFIVLGEPRVGKSCCLDVVNGTPYYTNREATIGIEFHVLNTAAK